MSFASKHLKHEIIHIHQKITAFRMILSYRKANQFSSERIILQQLLRILGIRGSEN